jgi:predicted dehydrogenase
MVSDSKKDELRVALIGFGLGGAFFHAPLIAATKGLRLTTVVTANAERQAQALRDYPGVQVASDPDHIWRGGHDLVVISTPNRSHVPLALAALDAGLAVVIDKPFAATAADARRVIASAREKKLAVSAYHIRRWDSECRTLRDLVARGELGRVLRFESRLERWRPEPKGGLEGASRAGRGGRPSLRYRQPSDRPGFLSVWPCARGLCGDRYQAVRCGNR